MLTFWKEAIEELQKRELENSSECDFLGETTLKTPGEKTSLFHSHETHLAHSNRSDCRSARGK